MYKLLIKPFLFPVIITILLVPLVSRAQDTVLLTTTTKSIIPDNESLLIKALDEIKKSKVDDALSDLEQLVKINPKFRLAQLMYADLLLARGRPLFDFGNISNAPYDEIVALRNEARARWQYHNSSSQTSGKIPSVLAEMDLKQKYAIVVDLSKPRLFLFQNRNGVPSLVRDFYVSIGRNGSGKYKEGDQKTPIGVYFVTDYIAPDELPEFYGEGAFPINYPNAWDRRNGHTGYGIWLHGTPNDTYSRPPRDSDGCIILSNQYFQTLSPYLQVGKTPVILADELNWINIKEWKKQQKNFDKFIEQWRRDWESRDVDLYLSHYSKSYFGLGKDYQSWVEYKRRVSPAKRFINISIMDKSMFLYPGESNLLIVTFEQGYVSDSFKRRFVKRQYWRMESDGKWRIVYEGSVS